jgi:hypothetical protein
MVNCNIKASMIIHDEGNDERSLHSEVLITMLKNAHSNESETGMPLASGLLFVILALKTRPANKQVYIFVAMQ